MEFINELIKADFFKFVEEDVQLDFIIQKMNESIKNEQSLYFTGRSQYANEILGEKEYWEIRGSIDFRSCSVSPELLFRGGLLRELIAVKELFEKRGLKFDFENERVGWKEGNPSYIKHELMINNRDYVIADDELERWEGYEFYLNRIEEIIEVELKLQDSPERAYKAIASAGEQIWYLIMEPDHFRIFEKYSQKFKNSQVIYE